jgi:hypothetical protein
MQLYFDTRYLIIDWYFYVSIDSRSQEKCQNICLSMCDVKVFLTFTFTEYGTVLTTILPILRVITKLPNSEQSYKGKAKTHNYINRQNQSTTGKL